MYFPDTISFWTSWITLYKTTTTSHFPENNLGQKLKKIINHKNITFLNEIHKRTTTYDQITLIKNSQIVND